MRTITVTSRGAEEVIDLTTDVDALAASMELARPRTIAVDGTR